MSKIDLMNRLSSMRTYAETSVKESFVSRKNVTYQAPMKRRLQNKTLHRRNIAGPGLAVATDGR